MKSPDELGSVHAVAASSDSGAIPAGLEVSEDVGIDFEVVGKINKGTVVSGQYCELLVSRWSGSNLCFFVTSTTVTTIMIVRIEMTLGITHNHFRQDNGGSRGGRHCFSSSKHQKVLWTATVTPPGLNLDHR